MPRTHRQPRTARRPLRNISEVRHFFRTNEVPIYFVGATPFNLLGLDRWVRNFSYVAYYDGWDGAHPRVFTPKHKPYIEFESGEEINNWLLVNPEVRAYMSPPAPRRQRPKVAMVFFDAETERICDELGYDLILPVGGAARAPGLQARHDPAGQRGRRAERAEHPRHGRRLRGSARRRPTAAGLGHRPGGADRVRRLRARPPSSSTTRPAGSGTADDIIGNEVKVMKRINNRPVAVEAVLTRNGTIVGPFMSELTGHPELTPYRGGWCGNEMYPDVLTDELRRKAGELVRRLGDRLGAEGYRGFFEVDVLVDIDTDEVYLGELNPRISGASSITNVTAGAYADIPLFAFHLLEFFDVDFELDIDEINERWRELAAVDLWSQMVIKETSPVVQLITAAAPDRAVLLRPRRERWSSGGPRWTGTSCRTSPRRSSCGSTAPGTTAGRAPTSACSSPRDGCSGERMMARIR